LLPLGGSAFGEDTIAVDILRRASYAADMDAWYLPIALIVLTLCCAVMGLFGADSRPGFANGRVDVKDRWFVHSKDDYR